MYVDGYQNCRLVTERMSLFVSNLQWNHHFAMIIRYGERSIDTMANVMISFMKSSVLKKHTDLTNTKIVKLNFVSME